MNRYYIYRVSSLQKAYYQFKSQRNAEHKTLPICQNIDGDYLNRYALQSGLNIRLFPYFFVKPGWRIVQVSCDYARIPCEAAQAFIFSSLVGDLGKVLVVEASPVNAKYIKEYIHQQHIMNVEFYHSAIYSKPGSVTFGHCHCTGNSRIFESDAQFDTMVRESTSKWQKYEVPANTLDRLVDGKIDFLNITINSYEYAGLKGATRILDENPHMLVTFPWMGSQQDSKLRVTEANQITKVVDLLVKRGYRIVFADARQQTYVDAPFITGLAIKSAAFEQIQAECTPVDLDILMHNAEVYADLW